MLQASLFRVATTAALATVMIGCSEPERNGTAAVDMDTATPSAGSAPAPTSAAPSQSDAGAILFVGTSLTAGLGVDPEQAYPAVLSEKIDSAGLPFRVVNAGVSGETSAGALRRIDWLLRQPFDVLVLETGANDMLRGTDLDSTRANIQSIIDRVRAERPDARIVLVGMLAPPNLGRAYGDRFRSMYVDLARENDVAFVTFLLDGVGGVDSLNLGDGIHPNPAGHRLMAETVWTTLEPVLR